MAATSQKRSGTTDLTVGKPLFQILRFALPLVLGTLFQQLYSFARNFPRKRSNCEECGGFRTSITKRQLPVTKPLWEKQLPMIE